MLFNSFEYVLFLWTVYVLFWSWRRHRGLRHGMLLAASYWFYAQADWRFLSLLVISSFVDFHAGARVQAARDRDAPEAARGWLL
ncbi:MAG: MBOAT family protein, partial [Planctomycetota bacterium]